MNRFAPLLFLASLTSGCVLVNDYGSFTVGDSDAGPIEIDGSVDDAGPGPMDADVDAGVDGGTDAGPGDCAQPDTIYVSATGDDANDGTIDAPLQTIAAAMAAAGVSTAPQTVLVAAGSFDVTYESANEVELVDGVTLRGGYDEGFCTYDPAANVTVLEERFSGGGAIDPMNPPIVGLQGDDLAAGVTLEGFRVSMGNETDDNHVGIRLRNTDAVIRDVTVTDGDGREMVGVLVEGAASLAMERVSLTMDDASHASTGVFLRNVASATLRELLITRTVARGMLASYGVRAEYTVNAPSYDIEISRSSIHGGQGGSNASGIYIADSQPTRNAVTANIVNNVIHGGESGGVTYGVRIDGYARDVTIYHNTIYTGETSAFGYGIQYDYDLAGPDVRNNVIFSGAPQQFCIWHQGGDWTGANTDMSNNLFFDCPLFLFYDGTNEITSAAMLNALTGSSANQLAGSVPLADLDGPDMLTGTMANNDWGFAANAPCSYTDGGFPTSTVTEDFFGNPRDGTPSIGAIEFTGTCTP